MPFSPAFNALLQPIDAAQMHRRQVSSRVNFVKYDDPACAEAIISV
jgi:putative SOS response-associated peptidase YedK